jgi:hypothetical protein
MAPRKTTPVILFSVIVAKISGRSLPVARGFEASNR